MYAHQLEKPTTPPSLTASITTFIGQNRALCAGAAASVFVMGTIFVNAIWYQPGMHPAPLFATRTAPQVETSEAQTQVASVDEKTTKKKTAKKAGPDDLVREIQTALSVRGYYEGKLDGLYGSRTRGAIERFQTDQGLDQDGKTSIRLLTRILMSSSSRQAQVPVPPSREVAVEAVKVETVRLQRASDSAPSGMVARIQTGLKASGYEDLVIDGKMGENTATAIQRFQLDYGLEITGEPSQEVVDKLTEIGALG